MRLQKYALRLPEYLMSSFLRFVGDPSLRLRPAPSRLRFPIAGSVRLLLFPSKPITSGVPLRHAGPESLEPQCLLE